MYDAFTASDVGEPHVHQLAQYSIVHRHRHHLVAPVVVALLVVDGVLLGFGLQEVLLYKRGRIFECMYVCMYVCMYQFDIFMYVLYVLYVNMYVYVCIINECVYVCIHKSIYSVPSWLVGLVDSVRFAVVVEEAAAAELAASARDSCSALASASSSSNSSLVGTAIGGAAAPLLMLLLLALGGCTDPDPPLEVPKPSKALNLASRAF